MTSSILTAINLIEDYRGKDYMIRTCGFLCTFLRGSAPPPLAEKLSRISSAMGTCRVVTRLFDDLSMLGYNLSCGTMPQEKNLWMRILLVLKNQLDQSYYWVEKLAWAADLKLMKRDSGKLWLLGLVIWALSLLISLINTFRNLVRIQLRLQKFTGDNTSLADLRRQLTNEGISFIMYFSDFVNAIGWLPPGVLWSGKVGLRLSGLCGVIASVIKLYRVHVALPAKADRILRSRR